MAERKYTRRQKKAARAEQQAAQNAAKPVTVRTKATGWRLPLIFCAVILLVVAAVWGWRKVTAPPPLPIPQELLSLAAQSHINLDGDDEGRRYKEELIAAGRGFSPTYIKDQKIEAIALEALDKRRIDVAVTAVQVVRDGQKRDLLLKDLATACMEECSTLPWAVFAVRNLKHDYPAALDLTRTLTARWDVCKKQPHKPAPAAGTETETAAPAQAQPGQRDQAGQAAQPAQTPAAAPSRAAGQAAAPDTVPDTTTGSAPDSASGQTSRP